MKPVPSPQNDSSVLNDLVGKANECNAFVDGHLCKALLDTGSQVTSISESFYRRYLSHRAIQSVNKLLKVIGVTGQNVQFLGYIELDIKFPEEESGVKTSQTVLVLVVPGTEYNKRVPLVVGTNVTNIFAENCHQGSRDQTVQQTTLSSSWKRAYKTAQLHQQFANQCEIGKIKIKSTSRRPIVLESFQTIVVWEITRSLPNVPIKAILEPHVTHSGVTTTQSLITLSPTGTKCRVPVEMTNTTPNRVVLSPKAILANVHLASEVVHEVEIHRKTNPQWPTTLASMTPP